MSLNDHIKNLKESLGVFEDLAKTQEASYNEAMETAKGMEDGDQKDWLINSLNSAKEGKLTAAEFLKQIKARGYGG